MANGLKNKGDSEALTNWPAVLNYLHDPSRRPPMPGQPPAPGSPTPDIQRLFPPGAEAVHLKIAALMPLKAQKEQPKPEPKEEKSALKAMLNDLRQRKEKDKKK